MQALVGRDRLGETFDDARVGKRARQSEEPRPFAAADAQVGEGERDHRRAIDFRRLGEARSEAHRRRPVEPNPDGMRRLPLPLAHVSVFFAGRPPPVDFRGRLAGDERPELPEGLAGSGAAPSVNAVPHRLRHVARGDDEAWQARREGGGLLPNRRGKGHVSLACCGGAVC